MKKWLCGFLAAVTAIFAFSSCASQNNSQVDKKLCYLEDSQMELLTPKNCVLALSVEHDTVQIKQCRTYFLFSNHIIKLRLQDCCLSHPSTNTANWNMGTS